MRCGKAELSLPKVVHFLPCNWGTRGSWDVGLYLSAYDADSDLPAESQWLHLPLITALLDTCRQVFPVVEYAYTTIPTYPSGQIGFMVCCKDAERDVKKPLRRWSVEEEDKLCRYYNSDVHEAAFALPIFARRKLMVGVGGDGKK